MASHSSVLAGAGLVWLLSAAAVVPWLAAGESGTAQAPSPSVACERSCGDVDIPYPFGMGPDDCMGSPMLRITCGYVQDGVGRRKAPFLAVFMPDLVVEVQNISLEQGDAKVLNPISSYCYDARSTGQMMYTGGWDLTTTPYSFSSTANKFTVVGCRALAYIGGVNNALVLYQTGCVSMCFPGNTTSNPCSGSGMGCCQTAIPQGMQYYQVWFDQTLNLSGINGGVGLFGPCNFAVLMKDTYDFSWLTSDMGWSSSNFSNISTGFNTSLGGKAPLVLDWTIGEDNCTTAKASHGYACVSSNSKCLNSASGRGYICNCMQGFGGNPYLPNGCEDIDECDKKENYNCFGMCTNRIGSFDCVCPKGSRGNASIPRGCTKDTFSPGAKIAAGILVGAFVALIAFLSTEVFLYKESKRRQGYFEQHGGRMLLRILQTEDNNIAFTLYNRKDLVRATRGFNKDNIVGEGAHGAVYKAILGGTAADASSTTVAVKRCKQIDESRTEEFVQELVVLCRVNHPNIVRLLGCCLHFEAPMLVYEFAPNGTLGDLLYGRPRRRVTLPTRLRIAAETAEALAHLHSPPYPTLHGDIKPQNILLGEGWIAKVSDFGCSTINDNVQVVPKGTLAYLDPEFLQDAQITEKTDVYSFGVVLIELLTGKNPQARGWKNLIRMFQNCMANGGTLGELLDADIVEEGSVGLIYAAAKLVSQCIVVPGKARPAMAQVAEELRRFSNEMPESHEARVALEFVDHRYSYTTTEGETTGFSSLTALSTELAR